MEIRDELGDGTSFSVYRVVRDGETYILKVGKESEIDPQRTFARRATDLARLDAPQVPDIHTVGRADGHPYWVMDFVDGRNLADRLADQPLEPRQAVRLGLDLLEVLDLLHAGGLVHRHLKPWSIHWDRGRGRLVDFGLLGSETPGDKMAVVESLVYAAPEQTGVLHRPVDARSDIYAVGAILYEALAGAPPFLPCSVDQLLDRHASRQPPDLREQSPGLSGELAEVIQVMLATEPDERFDSARQARRALEEWTDGVARSEPVEPNRPRGRTTGRPAQLADLLNRTAKLREQDKGGMIGIVGQSGMGKSRLLRTYLARLEEPSTIALEMTSVADAHRPFEAVRHLADRLVETLPEGPERQRRVEAAQSATGEPELVAEMLDGQPVSKVKNADSAQRVGLLARYIGELAEQFGCDVLGVDDLQAMDEASRRVLRRLGLLVDRYPLVVAVTIDETDAPADLPARSPSPPSDEQGAGGGADRDRWVELEAFTPVETERFVETHLGGRAPAEVTKHLHRTSGGNPMVLREYLSVLHQQLALVPDWQGWVLDRHRLDQVELSDPSEIVMRRRATDLDESLHRFLQVASVWGKRFPVDIVAEAAGVDQPERFVEQAQSHGFVEPVDPQQDRRTYRFSHSLFREIFRDALLEQGEVERWHQRLAEAADRLGGSSLFDVAYHYANGDLSAPERTLQVGLEVGRRMVEERAFDDALVFLRAARRAAEATGQATGGELPFLLGEARIQAGEVEEGRALLEQAIDEAGDDLSRARYQVQLNEVDVARLNLRRLEQGARRALGWLGGGLEQTGWREGSRMAAELARFVWWRRVATPRAAEGAERERQRLLTYIYEHLSLVATFQERPGLGILAQLGGITSAMRLGDSLESITGHTSYAVVMALAGRQGEVDWALDRARRMARRLDSPLADMRLESPASWCQHIGGEPVEAAARLDELLESSADQLTIRERSLSFNELCWNYGMRGYSQKVLKLYERWRAINRESREVSEEPISAIYAPAMVHARLCGRDELADQLRRASRRSFERGQSPYLERVHRSAVVLDEASSGASFQRVDEVIDARRQMGVDPSRAVFWSRDFFVYQVYARYYQWRASGGGEGKRLEEFGEAVDELAEAADGHPTLRVHMLRHRAEIAAATGQMTEASRDLGEAEQLATAHDNDWGACGVAHARANWFDRSGPADENRDARRAADLAERMGWRPYAQTLREQYNLGAESSQATSIQETLRNRSTRSLREMRLERQLEALMDVSLSTESLLEPERVARRAIEAAIRVLGAERGFLFLPDGDGSLRRAIGRSTDAEEITEAETYSRSVVDQVADSREPAVVTGASMGGQVGSRPEDEEAIRSVLAAPLVREDECVGVIYLDNRLARGVFSPEDVDVLRAIANHVTVALETARSAQLEVEVASERKQRAYAEKLRNFTERINASIDVDDILAHLVEQLDQTCRFDRATGVSLQGERPEVRVLRAGGRTDRAPFTPEASSRLLEEGSPLDEVLGEGSGERVGRVEQEADEPPAGLDASTAAYLALSLTSRGQTFGALLLERRAADPFGDSEVERIKMYASQVGVALEKAMLATVDPLTSLYNRRKFFELAERGFARAVRYQRRLSVMMLDIDDFKAFNDTHGHAAGDAVLEQIAVRCRETLRETDIIGRYGGEEFVVLLPSTSRQEAADEAAERLRRQIAGHSVDHQRTSLSVTVSIGVAGRREEDADIHDVIERADRHLYAAKNAGKNRVSAEDPA